MSEVIDIRMADDPRDVIHRAVRLLSEGHLVAFPTETVYLIAAYALHEGAVDKLQRITSEVGPEFRAVLLLKSGEEAYDYAPNMTRLGRKLSRRCWPGPVTIVYDVAPEEGLLAAIPETTRKLLAQDNELRIRISADPVMQNVLRLLPAPLVTGPEQTSHGIMPNTAEEIIERFGTHLGLVIDDGPCKYGQPATAVRVTGESWKIVEPGVVGETTLTRLASDVFLFVCTGNTCRSPMAEGLFRKFLAERLRCSEDELVDRGYIIASAGLAAFDGAAATPEAIDVLSKKGVDLRGHSSQQLTDRLLTQADHVYTMTEGHRESILASRPDMLDRVELLSRDRVDISDPIGGGIDEYDRCEQEIERHVRAIVAGMNQS